MQNLVLNEQVTSKIYTTVPILCVHEKSNASKDE